MCCFWSEEFHLVEGWEVGTSLVTLQGAVLFVVGAWTKHDRDPEYDFNGLICLRHKTLILRVVGRLMSSILGCKDTKCSDTCLVLSVILFVQLFSCMEMNTCGRP